MSTSQDTGSPFGRYVLRERIARGGMGEVFRAVAIGAGGFEKPVVVKRILPQLGGSERHAEMFIAEARVMSRLSHPNIVQVIDFGRGERDDYFLVMELVDGADLGAFHRHFTEPMPLGLGLFIASQMLRGLHHAHGTGETPLVHRDVSPGNVLLSRVGEVKVADFGVALVTGAEPATLAGKLGYMAPEQHRGEPLDARADVFSCGVVLFQILCGALPFAGDTAEERQREASRGAHRSLRALRADVPAEVEAIVAQAIAPDRAHRFTSARAMGQAIASAGVPLATNDDLAEAVERVVAATSARAKPVLALNDGAGLAEGTVVARDAASRFTRVVATELSTSTRAGDTTDVTELSSVRPPRTIQGPSETPTPRGSLRPLYGVAVLLAAVAAIAAVAYATDDDALRATTAMPTTTATTTGESPPPRSAVDPPATTAPPPPAPTTRATRTAPRATTTRTTTTRTAAPPPPSDCRGRVLLAGKGSWWVAGGPARVQAPGQYEWPCGSYALTATSRIDGRSVSRTLTIRQDQTAAARFE